VPP
jgi:hypothetical protein